MLVFKAVGWWGTYFGGHWGGGGGGLGKLTNVVLHDRLEPYTKVQV